MKITQKWLKNNNACLDACQWVAEQEVTDEIELIKAAMKIDKFNWVNWYLIQRFTGEKRLRYAIFAAKEVLWIFEKKYPENKAPRIAIEVAENYLKLPSADTANAADAIGAIAVAAYAVAHAGAVYTTDTSYAAFAAAHAAALTAHTAYTIAHAAALIAHTAYAADAADAADAAYAAWSAAFAAVNAAADAAWTWATANNTDIKNKIIQYGIALLKKEETKCH